MSDFAMKEMEKRYFEAIIDRIQSSYKEAGDMQANFDNIDFKENAENLLNELSIKLDKDKFNDFASDFEKGFKKLHKEMQSVIDEYENKNKDVTQEELVKKVGLKGRVGKLDKALDSYIKNPTFTEKIKNALQGFADFICESFCKYSGQRKEEGVTMLTKAFKNMEIVKAENPAFQLPQYDQAVKQGGERLKNNTSGIEMSTIVKSVREQDKNMHL